MVEKNERIRQEEKSEEDGEKHLSCLLWRFSRI